MNNIQISKNFNLSEFECKDESHTVKLDENLLIKLQKLRDTIGKPIIINSGYRTKEYNDELVKKGGASPNSQHILGKAADISVKGLSSKEIGKLAKDIGFDGIGIYENFVHVDVRGYKARW